MPDNGPGNGQTTPPVQPPVKPPAPGLKERIGEALFAKIADFFILLWKDVWEVFYGVSQDIIVATWGTLESLISLLPVTLFNMDLSDIVDTIKSPIGWRAKIKKGLREATAARFAVKLFEALTAIYGHTIAQLKPYLAETEQIANTLHPVAIPDPFMLMTVARRYPDSWPGVWDDMLKLGYDSRAIAHFSLASQKILEPPEIRALWLRGNISTEEMGKELAKNGYTAGDINLLHNLFWIIPGPQDLITFAVREAFYPDYIEKYGLGDEYPEQLTYWGEKQGLSDEWCHKYWYSHWVLPSVYQGYEMLHRRIIDKDALNDLFKAQDIMPYWRDKLLAISYHPYTRVDVRRMYKMGVLSRDDVYQNYLDLGYSPERADKLAEFTVRDAGQSERDLSKTDILQAYKRKLIDRETAKTYIMSLGYTDVETELYLVRLEYDTSVKKKDLELKWIRENYLSGIFTYEEAHALLGKMDLTGAEMEELFKLWDIERLGKMKVLSLGNLKLMLKHGILKESDVEIRVLRHGYNRNDTKLLIELWKRQK